MYTKKSTHVFAIIYKKAVDQALRKPVCTLFSYFESVESENKLFFIA